MILIGVGQFSCKICSAAASSLLILIALKPSAEYLLTADLFSVVPHTLQLTLCSHIQCAAFWLAGSLRLQMQSNAKDSILFLQEGRLKHLHFLGCKRMQETGREGR